MIYGFIYSHSEYPVAKWVKFFQVSRSGYYDHIERRTERNRKNESYKNNIKRIFKDSHNTFGPDRICGIIRKTGGKASYRKVSVYMNEMGLKSIHTKHKTRSLTNSRKARGDGYENYIRGRQFINPREVVCSDITYLKSAEGWLYLCTVKDIVSGEILGEATSETMKKELVIQAFLNAQARHGIGNGTIFHSDRGSQYTSNEFMNLLSMYGIKQSFSRVGMPGDNAWAESFFATLKKECIHFKQFGTRDELRQTVFSWIESFYNTDRVQELLGYLSPREYYRMSLGKTA